MIKKDYSSIAKAAKEASQSSERAPKEKDMVKKERSRLDKLVSDLYPDFSRNQIQSFIMQRRVTVDGQIVDKPGSMIILGSTIEVNVEVPKYVGRAGLKLERALEHFSVEVKGLVALDAGISTGGFTDCLLQYGAKHVYGVDVGYGQVHEKIRAHKQVSLLERTNLRYLDVLPEPIDIVTLDLSFISILKVIPAVKKLMRPGGIIITLIKPQFEADRADIISGGIVKNEGVYQKVITRLQKGMYEEGFVLQNIVDSPITGAKSGNKEFLGLWVPAPPEE